MTLLLANFGYFRRMRTCLGDYCVSVHGCVQQPDAAHEEPLFVPRQEEGDCQKCPYGHRVSVDPGRELQRRSLQWNYRQLSVRPVFCSLQQICASSLAGLAHSALSVDSVIVYLVASYQNQPLDHCHYFSVVRC